MTETYKITVDNHFTPEKNYEVCVGIAGTAGVMPKKYLTEDEIASTIKDYDPVRAKKSYSEIRRDKLGTNLLFETTPENPIEECMAEAAKQALGMSGLSMDDIAEIHISTISPTDRLTGTRSSIIERLGYETFPVIEMRHVCAGSIYALESARRAVMIKGRPVLAIVGDDVRRDIVNLGEWAQAGLFSAGAAAAVLVPIEEKNYGLSHAHFWTNAHWNNIAHMDPIKNKFYMNSKVLGEKGVLIYKNILEEVIKQHDLDKRNLYVSAHQINGHLLDIFVSEAELRAEQVINIVNKIGNTSSPSELLALNYALSRRVKRGDEIVQFALGAGFDFAYSYLKVDRTLIQPRTVKVLMVNHEAANIEYERVCFQRAFRNPRVDNCVGFDIDSTSNYDEAMRRAFIIKPDILNININGTADPIKIADIIHKNIGTIPTIIHDHNVISSDQVKASRDMIMKIGTDIINYSDHVIDFLFTHNIL